MMWNNNNNNNRPKSSIVVRVWLLVVASFVLLLPGRHHHVVVLVSAEKDSNAYPWGDNPNNRFRMYWNDARNVLQDLNQFSALYVKYHGCVWSECYIDSYDDDGENRDGDEYWYQYRTQPFCANSAFSLYGTLKGVGIPTMPWAHCSKSTYINSFFTYGGADTLLEALGKTNVQTVFDNYDYDDDDNYGNYGFRHSNAQCYEVEQENDDGNNNYDDDRMYGTSSTMGCTTKGKFVAALFQGQTCDGNYFLEETDGMRNYNRAMNGINCKQIWNRWRHHEEDDAYSSSNNNNNGRALGEEDEDDDDDNYSSQQQDNSDAAPAEILLASSWACDISLYPNGLCPDPYGLKRKYEAIFSAVNQNHSVRSVLWYQRLRTPLRFLSWLGMIAGSACGLAAYYISRKEEFDKNGIIPTLWHDFKKSVIWFCTGIKNACNKCRGVLSGEVRRRRKLRKLKRKLRKQKKDKKGSSPRSMLSSGTDSSGGGSSWMMDHQDGVVRDGGYSPPRQSKSRDSSTNKSKSTSTSSKKKKKRSSSSGRSSSRNKQRYSSPDGGGHVA